MCCMYGPSIEQSQSWKRSTSTSPQSCDATIVPIWKEAWLGHVARFTGPRHNCWSAVRHERIHRCYAWREDHRRHAEVSFGFLSARCILLHPHWKYSLESVSVSSEMGGKITTVCLRLWYLALVFFKTTWLGFLMASKMALPLSCFEIRQNWNLSYHIISPMRKKDRLLLGEEEMLQCRTIDHGIDWNN